MRNRFSIQCWIPGHAFYPKIRRGSRKMQMDTARMAAVSRTGIIRAEEHTAAAEQQLELVPLDVNRAAIVMYLLQERDHIVSLRKTFVNEKNTTTSHSFSLYFCTQYTNPIKPIGFYGVCSVILHP